MCTCMYTCMYACIHACIHACVHVCVHACVHACILVIDGSVFDWWFQGMENDLSNDITIFLRTGQIRHDFQRNQCDPAWFSTAVPILMVPRLGNRHFEKAHLLTMNGSNQARFSTKPVPSDVVFDSGSDFDGPKSWKPAFFNVFYDFSFVIINHLESPTGGFGWAKHPQNI